MARVYANAEAEKGKVQLLQFADNVPLHLFAEKSLSLFPGGREKIDLMNNVIFRDGVHVIRCRDLDRLGSAADVVWVR